MLAGPRLNSMDRFVHSSFAALPEEGPSSRMHGLWPAHYWFLTGETIGLLLSAVPVSRRP